MFVSGSMFLHGVWSEPQIAFLSRPGGEGRGTRGEVRLMRGPQFKYPGVQKCTEYYETSGYAHHETPRGLI